MVTATGIKLVLFKWFDNSIFALNPEVPALYLPWVWKEKSPNYRPRLVTLLTSDVIVNCLACPLIEECVKLLIFRACTRKIQQQVRQQDILRSPGVCVPRRRTTAAGQA